MKRYYLGLNANGPSIKEGFSRGNSRDLRRLSDFLAKKYEGTCYLAKNGRSALCIALQSYFESGDKIIVNAFTCYAVYEAVIEAGLVPVFADIDEKTLNFNEKTLNVFWEGAAIHANRIKGIIIQNSLGNPVDIEKIEKFAKKRGLTIIEDLAHSAGIRYPDGREAGTVGVAAALSFGKDKCINSISGGAVIFRETPVHEIEAPVKPPKLSDHLRARFYPLFTAQCKKLNAIHLGGVMMRVLIKLHFVERSADNKLDVSRRLSEFEAKLALRQLRSFRHRGEGKLRDFYFVKNRTEVLAKLRNNGYFFDAFWYEKPVSPERYYKKIKFPEKTCPVAMKVTKEIINFPLYYSAEELAPAKEIIKPYLSGRGYD